jgi:hypothetical protein
MNKLLLLIDIISDFAFIVRIWVAHKILPAERQYDRCVFVGEKVVGGTAVFTECMFIGEEEEFIKMVDTYTDHCLEAVDMDLGTSPIRDMGEVDLSGGVK